MLARHIASNINPFMQQGFRDVPSILKPKTWLLMNSLKVLLWIITGCLLSGLGCAFNGPKFAIQKPVSIRIEPEAETLTAGGTMTFGQSISSPFGTQVAWHILEANGGFVDSKGNYRAPNTPGTYRVQEASVSDPSKTAVSRVTVVAAPHGPITAPEVVESGASGLRASVPAIAGMSYAWTIKGGDLQSKSTASEIRFSAGGKQKVVLSCRMVNAAGDALTLTQEIQKAMPVVFHLKRTSVFLTAGRSIRFGYSISGGILPSVVWSVPDPRQGRVGPSGDYTAPVVPGRYIVRAVPDTAPDQAASIEVNVVEVPVGLIFAAKQVAANSDGHIARLFARPGLKSEWRIVGGIISGAANGEYITFSAGRDPELVLSCTLTNEAGDAFTTNYKLSVEPGG